jgi:hypothetical protein
MNNKPQDEHQWLQKLVGEWSYEVEVMADPDQVPDQSPEQALEKSTGTESVRTLGGFWILAEGQGEMPGCGTATTLMTIGYDPQKQRYIGTWVGSMMSFLWIYDGELDTAGKSLTLNSEGPAMTGEGKMAKYKDVIEFTSDDQRVMTSHLLGDDGQWHKFMTVNSRRKS